MSVELQHLKNFQSANLEQSNQQNVRAPLANGVIEWALIEIVVLLTGIRDKLPAPPH